ncbi:MAG TPA: hypothetical protein VIN63_08360 [Candidatus Limnocylindria bacterium]|jgi:hypothetical protein
MAKVIVGMTISLDGFVNDRNGSVALGKTEILQEAIADTGAVVMGSRAYEMANGDFTGRIRRRRRRRGREGQESRRNEGRHRALRLFENLGNGVQLETINVLRSPGRTDIKFRVAK